jgi:hypothetical protein
MAANAEEVVLAFLKYYLEMQDATISSGILEHRYSGKKGEKKPFSVDAADIKLINDLFVEFSRDVITISEKGNQTPVSDLVVKGFLGTLDKDIFAAEGHMGKIVNVLTNPGLSNKIFKLLRQPRNHYSARLLQTYQGYKTAFLNKNQTFIKEHPEIPVDLDFQEPSQAMPDLAAEMPAAEIQSGSFAAMPFTEMPDLAASMQTLSVKKGGRRESYLSRKSRSRSLRVKKNKPGTMRAVFKQQKNNLYLSAAGIASALAFAANYRYNKK